MLNSIRTQAREITSDLRNNEFSEQASMLEESISRLENEATMFEALDEIEGLCHVKALGDLRMDSFDKWEWPVKVSKLGDTCRKYRNRAQKYT